MISDVVSSTLGPRPASLMSCTGLSHLEPHMAPRETVLAVLDENHQKVHQIANTQKKWNDSFLLLGI